MINYKKQLIIIIPALENNRYSPNGDLERFGGTSLLEWKISQAKNIKNFKEIVIATPSKKIKKLCDNLSVKTFLRKKNTSLHKFYENTASKFDNKILLYLNPTSPFLSPLIVNRALEVFKKKSKSKDSMCSVYENRQYFFLNNKSINFNFKKSSLPRSEVPPLIHLTNGFYLINSNISKNKKSIIGDKPLFFKLDWLESLEIKTIKDINAYNFLISYYFDQNKK